MKKPTIKLPTPPRLPKSTRGTMIHSSEADYDRKQEKKDIEEELESE